MKYPQKITSLKYTKQRGIGLSELMISITIGLILLIGFSYFFNASQQTNKLQNEISRMQESGRIAMDIIGKAIRQADYKLDYSASTLMNNNASIAALDGTNGAGNAADTLIIRHDPAPNNNAGTTGTETNCEGAIVAFPKTMTTTPTLVEYGFHISNNQLFCDASPTGALGGNAIVDLIENMQITYGIKDSNKGISEYKENPTSSELNDVVAIKISLLIRSPSNNLLPNKQSYLYNSTDPITSDDYRLRHVYTSTFTLRNRK